MNVPFSSTHGETAHNGVWREPSVWAMVLLASLPLAMASHIAINHFVAPHLGVWTALFYPEVLAGALLLALTAQRPSPVADSLWRGQVGLAWMIGAWFVTCAVLQGAPSVHWPRRIGIEWVLGPVLGVAFLKLGRESIWRRWQDAYFWSLWAASFVALALYVVSFGIPLSFQELIFSNRTYLMQFGLAAGVYFGELTFGGVNDIAAFFGIGLLLYLASVLDDGESHPIRWTMVPTILVVQFLCYSRGGLLALGAGSLVLLNAKRRAGTPWSRRALAVATTLVVFGALVFAPSGAIDYWRGQLTVQENTTAGFRLRVWSHALNAEDALGDVERDGNAEAVLAMREETARALGRSLPKERRGRFGLGGRNTGETLSSEEFARRAKARAADSLALRERVRQQVGGQVRRLALGYGTGNFGLLAGTTPDMSVHNMFLEAFVAGGALGVVLYAAFWLVSVARAARFARAAGTVSSAGPLAVLVFMLVQGQTGHVRLENLGTFILGTVFWWLAARVAVSPEPTGASQSTGDRRLTGAGLTR
jgi:hypothetical protein